MNIQYTGNYCSNCNQILIALNFHCQIPLLINISDVRKDPLHHTHKHTAAACHDTLCITINI